MASATLASRIRGALLGLAVCDALGAPVEFQQRGSFPLVTEMLPNEAFGTPEGAFTDDTSMTLCLAQSLLDNESTHNSVDQIEKYLAWRSDGYMSSVGWCFDIGVSTNACLSRWSSLMEFEQSHLRPGSPAAEAALLSIERTIRNEYNKEQFCGNGSLMRVLPTALMASSTAKAVDLAIQSSVTTHPHPRCTSACAVYVQLVCLALQSNEPREKAALASSLANASQSPDTDIDEILQSRLAPYKSLDDWRSKPEQEISSSGYVVDSLEASLWAFFTTNTFRDGAVRVVNLGDDADTVGAIYGGLAGAYYGVDAIPAEWLSKMKLLDLLKDITTKILQHKSAHG